MKKLILIFSLLIVQQYSIAQTFTVSPNTFISSNNTFTTNLSVTGVGTIDCSYGLDLVCIDITHTWDSDLDIYLIDPSGTIYELTTDNGGGANNYQVTCFDMSAATNITAGSAPFNGTYAPEPATSFENANNGQNADGTWQLQVGDDASGDQGTLNSFSLTFAANPECFTPPPPPPANDDPCNAIALTVGASLVCTNTTGDNTNGTASAGVPPPGCASYSTADVWYSITVPASGSVTFSSSENGGFTDGGLAIYSGTCGALTLLSCNDDSGPGLFGEITSTTLTPGATIWIRIWDYDDGTGPFSICTYEPDPCGNSGTTVGTNDYCATPATLTSATGTFSANTAATFSRDNPGGVESVFCGSIENNSWYQFTAGSTAESFPITVVSGCGSGIQAEVYSITYDSKGCCNSFTSVSNCYNPGNTTLGTVNATGLTIGNDYMLMIDGFGGANCDFTISGWTGINILPVELTQFSGYTNENENLLTWTTASESNNDYFYIEKSTDGINYKKIGEVQGSGNSSARIDYEFSDFEINNSIVYYRLTQVDFDGTKEQVGTLVMTRELNSVTAYPNPSNGELNFTFNTDKTGTYNVDFIDVNGKMVSETIQIENNNTVQSLVFNQLDSGIYFVKITDKNSNVIEMIKVVKR